MDRPTRLAFAVAVSAHALAFAIVRVRERTPAERVVDPVSIEMIETTEPPERSQTAAAPHGDVGAPGVVAAAPKSLGRVATKTIAPPNGATSEVAESAPSGSVAAPEPGPVAKIPPLIDLDSPGKHAFILPPASSAKPTKEEQIAAKLDAQVKGALDAHDQTIDGGYGGPVVSAAHGAASSINAPQVGYATFDVETDGKGLVTCVKLVEYGGDLGWQKVQKDLQTNLQSQRLKVPDGASGVHVRVRVDAAMKYPSGAKKKLELHPEGIGVGGVFDLADIGQVPHRMVSVHLVEQHRL